MADRPKNIVVKVVTFVLFGLLIASFAVWGIGDIFRAPTKVQSVAEVGDVLIPQQDYARALSREVNRLSARFGGPLDMEQARALGIPDQVLNRMINRALFDRKAADLGLLASDARVARLIRGEPAFQNDLGEFDRTRFQQRLRILGLGEQEYLETLRRDIVRQQIAEAVGAGLTAPRELAEALYRYREERRRARYIAVRNDGIMELAEPDRAALEAFHEQFADKFMAPQYRALTLAQIRAKDLAAEVAVSEDDLRAEFQGRFEDFLTPERRAIEQMVFQSEAAAREARTRLDGGADFAATSRELTGDDPVDLGLVEKEALPQELAEAAFSLGAGTPSDPLESPLGWHILRVVAVEPRKEPTFEEVREDLADDLAMRLAVDSMISIANQLDDELAAGATLEEAAGRLNLGIRIIEAIDRQGRNPEGEPVENLPSEPFLETAFATETGRQSLLTESAEGDYFILRVDGVTPSQVRPLEEVRERVSDLWREAQRAKRAREKAEALAERAKAGARLAALAAEEGLEVATTEPLTRFDSAPARTPSPTLAAKLFRMAPGDVITADAPDGHVVAKLIEIQPADPAEHAAEVSEVRDSLAEALSGDLLEQFLATLRAGYGVTVNERQLDDLLATF